MFGLIIATSDPIGTLRGMTETCSIPATRSEERISVEAASERWFRRISAGSRKSRSTLHSTPLIDGGYAHAPRWLMILAVAVVAGVALDATADWARAATASCYGPGLYGNSMANGQELTPGTVAVAHKTLPLGTRLWVRVNGRTVLTPVKDRGPFVAGRSLDLTHGAVRRLGYSDCYAFGHRPVVSWRAR